MESAGRLRGAPDKFKGISVTHDMTLAEREQCKQTVAEAKAKTADDTSGEWKFLVRGPPGVLAATVQGKGSTRVNEDYQAANQSTENTKGLDSSDTNGTLDNFTVIYSNVDSLPDKKQQLISVINNASCKPN